MTFLRGSRVVLLAASWLLTLSSCTPKEPTEYVYGEDFRIVTPEPPIDTVPARFSEPVPPAFKATIPSGIPPQISQSARAIPGVAAASRITLSSLRLSDGENEAELSVAAADPSEFRPMAPGVTSRAGFVWKALRGPEIVITHEEHRRLGSQAGRRVIATGPNGIASLRIAAVAANGIPNLAGSLISLNSAARLGLGEPTLLLIATSEGANDKSVKKALEALLPGVQIQSARPVAGRAFLAGKAAEKEIGSFSYSANPDGTITQDPAWVRRYITSRKVPILGNVRCHRVLFHQLQAALKEVQDRGLTSAIDPSQYGGCYVPRFIARDQTRPVSMHAWGLAIDFNVKDNPQGAAPKMDPRVVEIFEQWGFRWGGRWSVPDGHHFELSSLVR